MAPLDSERRTKHRVPPQGDNPLEVSLFVSAEKPVEAELLDLSLSGVGLRLPAPLVEAVPDGQEVQIRFTATRHERSFTVPALARNRRKENGTSRCGFQFVEPQRFFKKLDSAFWRLFNRREAFRVTGGTGAVQQIRLEGGGVSADGRLLDVSVAGLAVDVPTENAAALGQVDQVHLSFTPLEGGGGVQIDGVIRYRTISGDDVRFGVEFASAEGHMKALAEYMAQRQEALLKRM